MLWAQRATAFPASQLVLDIKHEKLPSSDERPGLRAAVSRDGFCLALPSSSTECQEEEGGLRRPGRQCASGVG
eukprot:1372718-Rhodomonas_salina.1